jgi:autotransporter-associated beta strand protein
LIKKQIGKTSILMKPSNSNRFLAVSSAVAIAAVSSSAWAADVIKDNNTNTLNLTTSWVGGSAPTASDVALFNSTYATTGALGTGGLVTWQGIRIVDPGGNVIINNGTAGNEVALGSSGVVMSAATQDLNIQRLRVDASQTWDVASGRTFNIGNSTTVRAGVLSLGSGGPFTITKSGAGTVQLDTSNTAIGNVNWDIQAGLVRAIWNGSSAWGTGTITLGGGGIATGTNFSGSQGNWTWNNNITLTSSTSSFIDNQNISGTINTNRWLKLTGVISGSGNVEFRDTGIGFTNADFGHILAGTNINTGTVTIASGAEVRVGGTTGNDANTGNNGKLAADSALVVNNGTLSFSRLDSHTVANDISGSGSLRIGLSATVGTATTSQVVTLTGGNSYSGATTVNNGKLLIGNGGTTGNIGTGAVSVASGSSLEFNRSDLLDYKAGARMRNVSGAGDIVLDGGVKLFNYTGSSGGFDDANSWNSFSGKLIIKGGSEFQTIRNGRTAMGTAQVILGDATTSGKLSQIEGNWTWTNNIELVGSANEILNNSAGGDRWNKLQGVLSGDGNVTFKDTTGAMNNGNLGFILTGANTLTGTLTVDTFVRVGGVTGDSTSTTAGTGGTLGTANVLINSGKRLTFSRSDNHTVANAISGGGVVHIGSTGITGSNTQDITLSGGNSYTGGTELLQGTLRVNALTNIGTHTSGNTGYLAIKNGATFVYQGAGSETTSRNLFLDLGASNIEVTNASASLTWNDAAAKNGAFTKSGAGTLVLGGALSGAASVTVNEGTLRLNGNSSYTGATGVTAGTLEIGASGSLANTTTTISTGGTLAGGGSIGGATTIQGTHSPGFSPGTQTFSNSLSYASTATLDWELNDNTTLGRGTAYDAVNVTGGSFTLTPGATIDLSFLGTVDFLNAFWGVNQEWLVVDLSGSATAADSNLFSIGAITGGANYSPLLGSFGITRKDGSITEDSVYLTWTAIPEPSSALLGGIGMLMLLRRRR